MQTTEFWVVFNSCLLILVFALRAVGQDKPYLSMYAPKNRVKIDWNIFGQFGENPGRGLYGGIRVGSDSPIPDTRGICKDVVAALKELKVPTLRWPGAALPISTTGASESSLLTGVSPW